MHRVKALVFLGEFTELVLWVVGLQQHHEINSVRKRVIYKILVLFWIELCEYLAKLQMTGWPLEFALQSKCILPHSALNSHREVCSVMEATINTVMRCKKLLHPSNLECCIYTCMYPWTYAVYNNIVTCGMCQLPQLPYKLNYSST